VPSLLRSEAEARADLLEITSYDVTLDLRGERTFPSRTVIGLVSRGGDTFLDLKAASLASIRLDDASLPVESWADGRYPLTLPAGEHRIEVDATMRFRNDGEGLHRAVDPADGRPYLYQMSFMSAAPSVFACFDQPDLKAPYTLHVVAPTDWSVTANAAGERVEPGVWEFEPSRPLSTYFVTLVAGPYHRIDAEHDGIPLGLLARASMADALEADADELLTVTRQCFDELHRQFGVRYPFGKYDQAFVPDFNAGAMENPGCVTFREGLLFTSEVTRALRTQRATTVAHEMAHQWFGNLVSPQWWDDLWLNEAFAEYLGNRVTAAATAFDDALEWASLTRKNWGLSSDSLPSTHPVAGNGARDADSALQDFDGISYAKGHAVLRQLAERLGDDVFLGGVRDHFERRRFGNATMRDLFDSWERAGATDLDAWATPWLRSAGVDRAELTRSPAPAIRIGATPRAHALTYAAWTGSAWERGRVDLRAPSTPLDVPADAPVVLDADDTAWLDLTFDDVTAAGLVDVLGRPAGTSDPLLRATIWNTARNGVFQARLAPATALDLVCAGVPTETDSTAITVLGAWCGDDGDGTKSSLHDKLVPLLSGETDREAARARLHRVFADRAASAAPGSDLRLAALQAAIGTAVDPAGLRALLAGDLPDGVALDDELRWRILSRLTSLGGTDADELDAALAAHPDAKSQTSWAWCRSRLPLAEAKAWAWQRFTGEVEASNYELAAMGGGFWQTGREDLTAAYVDRYFADLPGTADVRAGWSLGETATVFFPITAMTPEVVERATRLLADESLDPTLRRVVADGADRLRRRIAARAPR
jgi:aminopeptidase N